jgi:hypothetical protein
MLILELKYCTLELNRINHLWYDENKPVHFHWKKISSYKKLSYYILMS